MAAEPYWEPIEVITEKPHIFIEKYAEMAHHALLCLSHALADEWDKAKEECRKVCDVYDDMLKEGFWAPEDKPTLETMKDRLRTAVRDKDIEALGDALMDVLKEIEDAVSYVSFGTWA